MTHEIESFISGQPSRMANTLRYRLPGDEGTSYHRFTMRSVFVLIERRGEA